MQRVRRVECQFTVTMVPWKVLPRSSSHSCWRKCRCWISGISFSSSPMFCYIAFRLTKMAAEKPMESIDPLAEATATRPPRNCLGCFLPLRSSSVTKNFCNCSRAWRVGCFASWTLSCVWTPLHLPSVNRGDGWMCLRDTS